MSKILLLVDDDPDDLALLQEAIKSINQDVLFAEAKDGLEALNYLIDKKQSDALPCLIVLDINMPVLDGREVLAILQNDPDFKSIPVVVFSTSSNPADVAYCGQFGIRLITKPFDMKQLAHKAEQLMSYCP